MTSGGATLPSDRLGSSTAMSDSPVLLYDGLCGFCDGTVQFILRHDRHGTLRFATLQGDYARGVLARHPELANVDSLVLVERDASTGTERVYVRSTGALRLARYLGGAWHLARVVGVVPRVVRDWGYDAFARIRYRVFGRYDSCPIPTPEQRARFID
jgi:predicted DCC family thiol-disulfide oxidoreductase YuxK